MAVLTATITSAGPYNGLELEISVPTATIPELPANVLPYDTNDKIALFDDSENKTVNTPISDFRQYVLFGVPQTPVPPVYTGSILEIKITDDMVGVDGDYFVNVPALENLNYALHRRGVGFLTMSEFNIYPSGGFETTSLDGGGDHDDLIQRGEVFHAYIFELATTPGGPTTPTGGLFDGIATIASNTQLTTIHERKVLHIAGGTNPATANHVEVTLWDIADAPNNTIVCIETAIGNVYQSKILAKNGQKIYINGVSRDYVWMGISEYLWIMKRNDGWYVLMASEGILNVGQPVFDYTRDRLNLSMASGQLVNRIDYPRLWEWITANSATVMVTEVAWQANEGKYKGKFSSGNGTTTFRMPYLENQFFRAIFNPNGTDPERLISGSPVNTAGVLQLDQNKAHTHGYKKPTADGSASGAADNHPDGPLVDATTTSEGGTEARSKNVGLYALIRN